VISLTRQLHTNAYVHPLWLFDAYGFKKDSDSKGPAISMCTRVNLWVGHGKSDNGFFTGQ